MKISNILLGSLLLASTTASSQICKGCTIQSQEVDSVQLKKEQKDLELEKRMLDLGYEKKVKSLNPDGSIEYEYVRKRRYCPACGMG